MSLPTNPAGVTTAVRQAGGSILVNGSISVVRPTLFLGTPGGIVCPHPNTVLQLAPGRGGKWRGVLLPIS
ncbi:MAG: hypothetical protein ING59_12560 [Burkholderiales bacterium]|nr:hypothetical protein [Burkholderiales bacterium]